MSLTGKEITEVFVGEVFVTVTYADGTQLRAETSKVADTYFSTSHRPTSLFPPVMRYISSDMKGFLLERPPSFVTLNISDGEDRSASVCVPLPWQLYAIQVTDDGSKVCGFFVPSQLYSQDDPLYLALHPGMNLEDNTIPVKFDPSGDTNAFLESLYLRFPVTTITEDYDIEAFLNRMPAPLRPDMKETPYDTMHQALRNWSALKDISDQPFSEATDDGKQITARYWIDHFIETMAIGSTAAKVDKTNIFTFFESLVTAVAQPAAPKKAKVSGIGL